jgi:RNA polymerase sigma-70 factor (ECF subfamily)
MIDWSQIVAQHGPMVFKTAYRVLNNDADAADCFQRTFLAAFEVSQTDVILNWSALLKRVALARAIDLLRQRHRESGRLTTMPDAGPADNRALQPIHAATARELAEHLREAVAHLEAQQAQVFCLACLEDLSYQEIAEQLGLTVNHVGVLLNRARAALRRRLEAHDPKTTARLQREDLP